MLLMPLIIINFGTYFCMTMEHFDQLKAEDLYIKALDHFFGIEREKNLIRAQELLVQSAELGLSKSYVLLGDWYLKKYLPSNDFKEAFQCYTSACDLGNSRSYSRLAMCYEHGYGVEVNLHKHLLIS